MANLKNKILQALRNEKNMEETFDSLSTSQENLLKNNSNPVFSNKDKNKILKQYTNLQNLGKSLYRYNALKENDYDAEGEKSAMFLSDQKEKFDQWNNIYAKSHKISIEEAIADSERDQVANRLGRERGRKYPYCDCSILMHDLLPNYKK